MTVATSRKLNTVARRYRTLVIFICILSSFWYITFHQNTSELTQYVSSGRQNVIEKKLTVEHQGDGVSIGTENNSLTMNSLDGGVSLEAARKSMETLVQYYSNTTLCKGQNVTPPNWWIYHWECKVGPFLPNNYSSMANITPPDNGVFVPRMQIENFYWYGQMLDFYVSELFFLHPTPIRGGRFLEIGAYTGLEFTNTLFFEHYLDWEGWLFEPTTCFDLVVKNRPRAKSFQMGLCQNATEIEFESFGNCKSRVSPCVPLTDIEDDWSRGFDFISIDVEGNELEVLKAIDLEKIPVKVFVIEWRSVDGETREEYLTKFGYVLLKTVDIFNLYRGDQIFYRPDLIQPHLFQQ